METYKLVIDGAIILVYFVAITALGLYMGRREKTLKDYALGGRSIPWWAVMASIIAAETSAATFLTVPGEGYTFRGIIYVQIFVGMIIARILVGIIFLKPYYDYRVYTVYDYLAIRFGSRSKNYVSILFLIFRTLAMGVRVYVPALVMVLAWRLFVQGVEVRDMALGDSWVPYVVAIVVLVLLTGVYTMLGGIKAVIWTDVIQATLMFGSAIVAIGALLYTIGGNDLNLFKGLKVLGDQVPEMKSWKGYLRSGFEAAPAGGSWWDYTKAVLASPYTIFSALIASTVNNMGMFGTDQDMVQRMLTATDYRRARRSLLTSAFMDIPIAAAFSFIGVLLIVFYTQMPELRPEKPNDVFGVYILSVMPFVLRGFVLAGLFATAMGSLSAALNALATSVTNDWYLPYFGRKHTEVRHIAAARGFTAFFALLMIVIAGFTAFMNVRDPNQRLIPIALGVAGLFIGPMLGVFLVGMLTHKRGHDLGNMLAISLGLLGVFFITGQHGEMASALAGATGEAEKAAWLAAHLVSAGGDGVAAVYRDLPWYIHLTGLHVVEKSDRIVFSMPAWMPVISFTWFAFVGAGITFLIGVMFRTPETVLAQARHRLAQAEEMKDTPLAMRH